MTDQGASSQGPEREEREDIDLLAAEYVLGVLNLGERRAVAARRMREPDLAAAIARWELWLAPLNDAAPEVAPPEDVWPRIEEAAAPPAAARIALLWRARARRWRNAAIAGGALAASLAIALGVSEFERAAAPQQLVAVLQRDANSPAFMVAVNLKTRELSIRPLATEPPPGKSYELWIINPQLGAPKSLGVIEKTSLTSNEKLRAYAPDLIRASLYAVTVEPEGGSNGTPSGPPVFTGRLVDASP